MKKQTSVKKTKKQTTTKTVALHATPKQKTYNPWSMSIYFYWFIILFFIAATFYILGRSHGVLNHRTPLNNNVTVTEEALMGATDYYESGKTKLLTGDVDGAIVDLDTAIDSGAATADMYILRGEAYMQSANYRGALDDFNTAIEMNPQSSVAYYDRALLNTRLEDYEAALNDINNALAARATNDNDVLQLRDLYAKRGQLNLWLKNWDGAIADYTNSLARPDGIVSPTVYAERAEAYTATGDYASAISDYSTAVRIIAEQIQGLSTGYEREQMSANAMSYFEKSAALNFQIGNIDAARNDLESANTIAMALNDTESVDRINALLADIQ
ncbi:MAG: tetratricopeptide repeat protein [Alphaproteobacteria bacterium]|nr:tetratricopeptide repeat protein [Alphaproteobacteria bacterium]